MSRETVGLSLKLSMAASTAMILASILLTWAGVESLVRFRQSSGPSVEVPTAPIPLDGAHRKGSERAKVVVVEFGDLECPFCRTFGAEVMPELDKDYIATGKVLFVIRHFPLPVHANARMAAEATECAARQGQFWEMHDGLLSAAEISEALVQSRVGELRLNGPAFAACRRSEAADGVRDDEELAAALGIRSTPTFFFGYRENNAVRVTSVVTGLGPIQAFRARLDRLLSEAEGDG